MGGVGGLDAADTDHSPCVVYNRPIKRCAHLSGGDGLDLLADGDERVAEAVQLRLVLRLRRLHLIDAFQFESWQCLWLRVDGVCGVWCGVGRMPGPEPTTYKNSTITAMGYIQAPATTTHHERAGDGPGHGRGVEAVVLQTLRHVLF